MPSSQLSKIQIGLAGEHLVASQLFLRGYVASMTLKNYPGIDIFVHNPETEEHITIQVKTKRQGKLYYVPENVDEMDSPFVFVYFKYKRGEPHPEDVEFYIVPAKDVAIISKNLRDDYLRQRPHVKREQPRMIDLPSLAQYKDRWDLIGI